MDKALVEAALKMARNEAGIEVRVTVDCNRVSS
jgi:hypothetical protein